MTRPLSRLRHALAAAAHEPAVRVAGTLVDVTPAGARAVGLSAHAALGDRVVLPGATPVSGEIVAMDGTNVSLSFFEPTPALAPGATVLHDGPPTIAPHPSWRGRTLDGLARPLDGGPPLLQGALRGLDRPPPLSLARGRIAHPIRTGVRTVDLFTPLCLGQRIGIFAGSGVGKSTLLSMLARPSGFDTIVVALVGERGREVRETLEGPLAARRADTVAVVATADESAAMRRLAAKCAMTVAESFRDAGQSVLLLMDSVTRYAQAAREIGLAAGEPAVARGFPPSVFGDLPRLLERAGPGPGPGAGTITAFFTVLVDGDDHNDPIADAIRGTLDGHIVLDRAIADRGRFPAIDVLRSLSRLSHLGWTPAAKLRAAQLRAMVARYEETRDLRALGGMAVGADPQLDEAVALVPKLYALLAQDPSAPASTEPFAEIDAGLAARV